jgi:hypothetical protein
MVILIIAPKDQPAREYSKRRNAGKRSALLFLGGVRHDFERTRLMKLPHSIAGAACAVFLTLPTFAAVLPMDAPTKMGEVTAVCTGVGSAKDDPQWSSYPIKLEFSNGGAQFVSSENVKLMSSTGAQLAEFDCGGPWVLLNLPKGSYSVAATVPQGNSGPRSAKFTTPASGQKRVEIQFPAPPNQ